MVGCGTWIQWPSYMVMGWDRTRVLKGGCSHSLPTSPACVHTSSHFYSVRGQGNGTGKRRMKASVGRCQILLCYGKSITHKRVRRRKQKLQFRLGAPLSSETVIIQLPARHPTQLNSQEGVLRGSLLGHRQLLEGKRASLWTCISQDVCWLLAKHFLSDKIKVMSSSFPPPPTPRLYIQSTSGSLLFQWVVEGTDRLIKLL